MTSTAAAYVSGRDCLHGDPFVVPMVVWARDMFARMLHRWWAWESCMDTSAVVHLGACVDAAAAVGLRRGLHGCSGGGGPGGLHRCFGGGGPGGLHGCFGGGAPRGLHGCSGGGGPCCLHGYFSDGAPGSLHGCFTGGAPRACMEASAIVLLGASIVALVVVGLRPCWLSSGGLLGRLGGHSRVGKDSCNSVGLRRYALV